MNKKLVCQVGNNKKLYYDARPTKYQHMYMFATSMMKTEYHKNLSPLRTTLGAVSTSITVRE